MAITLADFTKIWASTSPLTPYSFTESNYKEGWNFIGGTPPSRQMWDSIQNQNDEKLKYIVDNFLPLSGGTMTGAIESTGEAIKNIDDTSHVRILGGTDSTGSYIGIWAKDNSATPGVIQLRTSDGTNNKSLVAYPNGNLTWNNKNFDHTVDLSVFKTAQQFTAPTIISDRIKDIGGGYKRVGNVVYIYMRFKLNTTLTKGGWGVAGGFPAPYNMGFSGDYRIPLIATAWYGDPYSGNVSSAFIDSDGTMRLITNGQMESSNYSTYYIYTYGNYYTE